MSQSHHTVTTKRLLLILNLLYLVLYTITLFSLPLPVALNDKLQSNVFRLYPIFLELTNRYNFPCLSDFIFPMTVRSSLLVC